MSELMSKLGSAEITFLAMVLGGVVIALTAIIAHHWWKIRNAELQASLKQEMLRQGKSIEEIERLLRASGGPAARETVLKPGEVPDEVSLVRELGEHGYDGDDIEVVMRLYTSGQGTPAEKERAARLIHEMIEQEQSVENIEGIVKAARMATEEASRGA